MSLTLQSALCGLAFFAMAIAVWQRALAMSDPALGRPFFWLAGAGALHALSDWLPVVHAGVNTGTALAVLPATFSAASAAMFMQFALILLAQENDRPARGGNPAGRHDLAKRLRVLPSGLFLLWAGASAFYAGDWLTDPLPDMAARLLALPATLLCALALFRFVGVRGADGHGLRAPATLAATAFLAFAVLNLVVLAFWIVSDLPRGAAITAVSTIPGMKLYAAAICLALPASTAWLLHLVDMAERDRLRLQAETATGTLQQAVAKLEGSEEKARKLLEAAPIPLAVVVDDAVRYANSTACTVLGLEDGALAGRRLVDLFMDPDDHREILARLDSQDTVSGFELALRHTDGGRLWALLNIVPIVDDGRPALFIGWLDITRRKQAEMELRESQRRFRDFADVATDWYWESDHEHKFTMLAGSAAASIGITPDFLLGRDRTQILDNRVPPGFTHEYRALLDRHAPFRDFRYPAARDSGEILVISTSGMPLVDDEGNFRGYRGVARDVTAQTRLEQKIADSERRYRSLIETALVGIFIIAEDWRPLLVNDAAARLFGFENATELMALDSIADLLEPNDAERLTRYGRSRLDGRDAPMIYEFQGRRKDGTTNCLLCNARVIDWDGTQAIHAMVIDITERKRTEEALRNSERQLRLIADAMPAMIFYLDNELRFQFLNEEAETWYRRPRQDVIGRHVRELIGADRYAKWQAEYATVLSGITVSAETTLEFPDGVTRVIHGDYIPHHGEDGKVQGLFGLVVDLTERRALEESLRQAQKMEAVGQLTGGIAHDFNNLLGVILGNAEVLRLKLPDDLLTERKALAMIERAGERGASLTRQLLAFSRRQTLAPKVVGLDVIVDGMTDLLSRTIGEDIVVNTTHPDRLWHCRADPTQLESAILNLAINSRDAMPTGGVIRIETRNLRRTEHDDAGWAELTPGDYVELRVSDTGVGMPDDVVQRAFEPFFTTKDVGRGTGLGLSMVYGFVRQSGGQIVIESSPEIGTTVRLCLPRAEEQAAPDGERQSAAPDQKVDEAVLLVEDSDDLRASIARMLTDLGYTVDTAADPAAAMDLLKSGRRYALLLSDVVMPGSGSGPDIGREAAMLQPGIGIVYMSGYAHGRKLASANGEDMPFLQKPFRRSELAEKLAESLAGVMSERHSARP